MAGSNIIEILSQKPAGSSGRFGGGADLHNAGTIEVTSNCSIDVPFANGAGSWLEIKGIGNPTPDHALLHVGGFNNAGTIDLTSSVGPADARLEVAGNLFISPGGEFRSSIGTLGNRSLMGQTENQGAFTIEQDLDVDANTALTALVAELVETGQGTLAKYRFDGDDPQVVADGSSNELHGYNEGAQPVPGVFGKARFF